MVIKFRFNKRPRQHNGSGDDYDGLVKFGFITNAIRVILAPFFEMASPSTQPTAAAATPTTPETQETPVLTAVTAIVTAIRIAILTATAVIEPATEATRATAKRSAAPATDARRAAPAVRKAAPVVRKAASVARTAASVVTKAAPVVSKAAPVTDQTFECIICLEAVTEYLWFEPTGCNHKLCGTCASVYVHQLSEPTHHQTSYDIIPCPGFQCKGTVVSNKVLPMTYLNDQERISLWWRNVLTKACIKNKVTCPQVDCGAVFDVDAKFLRKCIFSECYECHKGLCIACQERWHPGVIKIFDDHKELKQTLLHAEKKNWARCPTCFQIIERINGCLHILCHCGENFCYRCGGKMYEHNVCANRCNYYSDKKLANARKKMFAGQRQDAPAVVAV